MQAFSPFPSNHIDYYLLVEAQQTGPYSEVQLLEMISEGKLPPDSFIWKVGFNEWIPAADIFPDSFTYTSKEATILEPPSPDETLPVRKVGKWNSATVSATVLIAGVGLALLFSARAPKEERNVRAQASEEKPIAFTPVPHQQTNPAKRGSIEIKGLYIGMQAAAALDAVGQRGEGKFWIQISEYKRPGKIDYDILYLDPRYGARAEETKGGSITVDGNTKRVTEFVFIPPFSDILFKTEDLSSAEFAQRLINAYGIPQLKVVNFQGNPEWRYESPDGWSISITEDKQVNVWETSVAAFD